MIDLFLCQIGHRLWTFPVSNYQTENSSTETDHVATYHRPLYQKPSCRVAFINLHYLCLGKCSVGMSGITHLNKISDTCNWAQTIGCVKFVCSRCSPVQNFVRKLTPEFLLESLEREREQNYTMSHLLVLMIHILVVTLICELIKLYTLNKKTLHVCPQQRCLKRTELMTVLAFNYLWHLGKSHWFPYPWPECWRSHPRVCCCY